jgi:hypothetical protein
MKCKSKHQNDIEFSNSHSQKNDNHQENKQLLASIWNKEQFCTVELQISETSMKINIEVLQKLKIELTYDPVYH